MNIFHKSRFLILSLLFLCASNVFAQQTEPAPKTIPVVILNDKALSLPEPVYPAAARAVGARGVVNVQVTLDEDGNVATATAVSGHPLLRAAAVMAARAAKFSPDTISGKTLKGIGIIVYNFYFPLQWRSIGMAFGDANVEIEDTYKLEWALSEISAMYPEEGQQLQTIIDNFKKDEENFGKQASSINELVNALRLKLSNKPEESRYFELGLAIGRIKADYFDDAVLQANLPVIKDFVDSLPESASKEFSEDALEALQYLSKLADKSTFTRRDKTSIKGLTNEIK